MSWTALITTILAKRSGFDELQYRELVGAVTAAQKRAEQSHAEYAESAETKQIICSESM